MRKWEASWVEGGMLHSIEFRAAGGVQGAVIHLREHLKFFKLMLPDVYHLKELPGTPEPPKFHPIDTWPKDREGILWVAPLA